MKKIITLLSIFAMLFAVTSCDGNFMDGLEDAMNAMKHNVAGENAAAAESAAATIGSINSVQTIEPGQDKIDIFGKDIPVPEGFTKFLAPITADEKNEIVDALASSLKNDKSRQTLIDKLSETVDDDTYEALQGSAAVLQKQFIEGWFKEDMDNVLNNAPEDVKVVAENLLCALDSVVNGQEKVTVTKADILTIQLIEAFSSSFINDIVVPNLPEEGEEPDPNQGMPAIPPEIIAEANTLITVVTQVNTGSELFPENLIELFGGLMGGIGGDSGESAQGHDGTVELSHMEEN